MSGSIGVAALPPERRTRARLERLSGILRCPVRHSPLECGAEALRSGDRVWPLVQGVPNLFLGHDPVVHADTHVSHGLPPQALALIASADGLVLNLSAGGTVDPAPHVVEVEAAVFRNTDIVADAHVLPFQDGVFDVVLAINAFEHYRDPPAVSRELWRVLRPGGHVLIHTAFLQPLHEAPYHFFNCTEYGLREWMKDFSDVEVTVTANFNPLYVLAWLATLLESGLHRDDPALAQALGEVTLARLAAFWRSPGAHDDLRVLFDRVPADLQRQVAGGFECHARKRPADAPAVAV